MTSLGCKIPSWTRMRERRGEGGRGGKKGLVAMRVKTNRESLWGPNFYVDVSVIVVVARVVSTVGDGLAVVCECGLHHPSKVRFRASLR